MKKFHFERFGKEDTDFTPWLEQHLLTTKSNTWHITITDTQLQEMLCDRWKFGS